MPIQYYLPRNNLTYQYRYTDDLVPFRHYVTTAKSFLFCAIGVLCDLQPCKKQTVPLLLDLMDIFMDGQTKEGWTRLTFFKQYPVIPILDLLHYAQILFHPTKHDLVLFKTHLRLYQYCSFIDYTLFLFSKFAKSDICHLQEICKAKPLFPNVSLKNKQ